MTSGRDDPRNRRRPHEQSILIKLLRTKHPQHVRTMELDSNLVGAYRVFLCEDCGAKIEISDMELALS